MRAFFLMLPLLLGACSVTTYRDGKQTLSRLSVGMNAGITSIAIRNGNDGVKIIGFNGNQTEGLKAAVEGAVKGLVEGAKL